MPTANFLIKGEKNGNKRQKNIRKNCKQNTKNQHQTKTHARRHKTMSKKERILNWLSIAGLIINALLQGLK